MTESDGYNRKSLFLSILFTIILLILSGITAIYVISDKSIEDAFMLTSAARTIDEYYPGELNWDEMLLSAREAMFENLDRYSSYYQDQQFEQLDEELTGGYTGIGISVLSHDSGLLIMSVRENGPAAEAGLLTGDIITRADSVDLADLSPSKSSTLLRGEENSSVTISVYRPSGNDFFDVSVTRRKITFLHIPFAGYTKDSVVYIRLFDFDHGASDDIKAALDSLVTNAAFRPKGLILDLQGNPGGLFSEAYETADIFLDEGYLIVGTDGRSRWKDFEYHSTGKDLTDGLPMVILVDGGSASSSEIVSGALQTAERAVLVGDTTFGKGLVQGFVQFPNGDGLKLTISRYFFDDSVYLNDFDSSLNDVGHGLIPDYFVEGQRFNFFQRELENSLLLGQFTALYQNEIIADYEDRYLDDSWVEQLTAFIIDKKYEIKSYRTVLAEDLHELAKIENHSNGLQKITKKLIDQSQQSDLAEFFNNNNYIKNRLIQLAYQRKYGDYHAYKEVLLHIRPEIQLAENILLENL